MNEQHIALKKFSYQIKFAVDNYTAHGLDISKYANVLIGGLGGSGIGGRITKNIFSDNFPVPIECVAEYGIPAYVNEKTLCILASYSGNTEETLAMYNEVKGRNCDILVLTSGGKLNDLALQNGLKTYKIEPGFQPRMALGFSLTYLIQIFSELVNKDVKEELLKISESLSDSEPFEDDAQRVFDAIKQKTNLKFIVVSDIFLEALSTRFAQQIQENAKHECFTHIIPEANHNVIESYYGQMNSVFFFLNSNKNERVTTRFEFLNNLLQVEYNKIVSMEFEEFDLNSIYETIHRLDWLSLYVADYRRVDSLNVPNIASLKEFLDQA